MPDERLEILVKALRPFAQMVPKDGLYMQPVRIRYSDGSKATLSPTDFRDALEAIIKVQNERSPRT